jgi:hypothetical protein
MTVLWLLLFFVSACLILLLPTLWVREIYNHYRGSRAVTCPETHRQVAVRFAALHAAVRGLSSTKPDLRLADCTRWPQRARCGQECIPEALHTAPYTQGEAGFPKAKKIYHLPVLAAAVAAWVLGMVWHSEYLFRERWMHALGLSDPTLRQIAEWWTPHLISVAVLLLFAYGVSWLLAYSRLTGVWAGILASLLLWVSVAAAALLSTSVAGISTDLLKMETAYTFLASIVIGAIVGGLSGRLVEEAFEAKGGPAVPLV